MTGIVLVSSGSTATKIVAAGDGPTLIYNSDPTNPVYVGDTDAIRATDSTDVIPLPAGGRISVNGENNLYGITPSGITVTLYTLVGGTAFFQPPNLAAIGGASVFSQATAPPTTAPPFSLWFKTDGSLWQLINSVWTQVQFNSASILEVGTILSGLIAAGQIYAGIVNGTEIDGALLRVKNASGSTIMTINKSAGTWILYLDTGSATQGIPVASASYNALFDEFGYSILAGVVNYHQVSTSNFEAVQIINGQVNFLNATSLSSGTWNVYSSLQSNSTNGLLGFYDNIDTAWNIGHQENSGASGQSISSTSAVDITGAVISGLSATSYHGIWEIFYTGAQAAGTPLFALTPEGGAVVSFSHVEFRFWESGGITTRINANAAAFNTFQQGPTLVTAMAHATIEAWFTLSTGGNVNVAAKEGTSGDSFSINAIFARCEKRQ